MTLHPDQLGSTASSEPVLVTREAAVAYARATGDDNPEHLAGVVAPPLFAVVPALKTMVALKRRACEGFTLHGEHDIVFHRPLLPGMRVLVTAELIGIQPSRAGALVVTRGETRDEAGTLLNEQVMVNVAHGRPAAVAVGRAPPDHRRPPGLDKAQHLATLDYPVDRDQTLRYAEASGDRDSYTFDDAEARARGLPGAIVHGLCTMALLGRAVVAAACGGDSRRLRRLAVRFSGLLLLQPGQRLVSNLWRAGGRDGRETVAAEADDRAGNSVVRHGWAEIGT